ncbi:hypothetical protein SK128_007409, partial [Halocaridina rubra]
ETKVMCQEIAATIGAVIRISYTLLSTNHASSYRSRDHSSHPIIHLHDSHVALSMALDHAHTSSI